MDFTDRHVVITGASSGIGRATAEHVAALGGRVTLLARRADRLAELAASLGADARWQAVDVANGPALDAALDAAIAGGGPIDGLFLNAGTGGTFAPVEDYAEADFAQVMAVNLTAPFRAVARALRAMKARRRGAILVTGSLASERGMANNVAYVASKHAVLGLARAVALEAAPFGVRCNCVVPGFIETEMFAALPGEALEALAGKVPQGRTGSAEELAAVAAFLLSDAASHVTGQSIAVDGGVLGTLRV
ncbi:SDR family NAD(P)-dependent oxidoreductase [Novosphingobium sp. ST904]|nr:SDR family NAD(P)-dependent oxidoreductase [Novosphingobium sp. ST904]KPH66213.1 short-chain dehydrogenase [Novosphingobium sp. ST904]TCM36127.1 NAD(P)-dependent dehydrogenase (short-subunit alcohol dehydrogenase family) [Novosphingobium sp. ST904]